MTVNKLEVIQYKPIAVDSWNELIVITTTIIFIIIFVEPAAGFELSVACVPFSFNEKKVTINTITGIIKYQKFPLDKANQGVVPSCNPKNLPSNIAGVLFMASKKAINNGNCHHFL